MKTAAPLVIKDLVKDFGSLRAVDHVSLHIEEGEIFGLLGPNGAGKTTTISMITTLETATSGSIEVFGHDIRHAPSSCKQLFGAVPQENMSHGFFNVEEILQFHSGYYGLSQNQAWIEQLLNKLDLYQHRHKRARQLSGGMKKRLLIAKALVHKPRLILLDEPTAGVDIELRDILWDFIRELQREGSTVLLTTHYLQEAELLCDRVAIIDQGRIQRVGDTKALISELTTRELHLELRRAPRSDCPHLIGQQGDAWQFRYPSDISFQDLMRCAELSLEDIENVAVREGTLEEAVRQVIYKKEGQR